MALHGTANGQDVSERILWPRSAPEHDKHRREGLHKVIAGIVAFHVALGTFLIVFLVPDIGVILFGDPFRLLAIVVISLTLVTVLMYRDVASPSPNDRLILTPDSITYRSSRPLWLRWMSPDWTLYWSDIESISLQTSVMQALDPGVAFYAAPLVFDTGLKKRKLLPFGWVDMDHTIPTSRYILEQQLRMGSDSEVLDMFQTTPLLSYVISLAWPLDLATAISELRAPFETQELTFQFRPPAKIAIKIAIGLIVYTCIAYWTLPDMKLVGGPIKVYLLAVEMAMAGAVFCLLSAQMTFLERLQVSLTVWFVINLASYPTLLHLNRLTSFDAMQSYTYVLNVSQKDRRLQPVYDPHLPMIKAQHAYWRRCPIGSTHLLHLQKGGLGLYLLDRPSLRQEMKAYPCP